MDLFCFGVLLDVEDEDEVEEAEDDESEDISFSGGAVVTICVQDNLLLHS